MPTSSALLRAKYGTDRQGKTYARIGAEFGVSAPTAWSAINRFHNWQGRPRGFAAMSEAKRREITSQGGRRAHELGVAHRFTSEEGKKAVAKYWKSRREAAV